MGLRHVVSGTSGGLLNPGCQPASGIGALLGAAGWWMHLLTRTCSPARLLGAASRIPVGAPKPKRRLSVVSHAGEVVPR